jgi:hypothetical protein
MLVAFNRCRLHRSFEIGSQSARFSFPSSAELLGERANG